MGYNDVKLWFIVWNRNRVHQKESKLYFAQLYYLLGTVNPAVALSLTPVLESVPSLHRLRQRGVAAAGTAAAERACRLHSVQGKLVYTMQMLHFCSFHTPIVISPS